MRTRLLRRGIGSRLLEDGLLIVRNPARLMHDGRLAAGVLGRARGIGMLRRLRWCTECTGLLQDRTGLRGLLRREPGGLVCREALRLVGGLLLGDAAGLLGRLLLLEAAGLREERLLLGKTARL